MTDYYFLWRIALITEKKLEIKNQNITKIPMKIYLSNQKINFCVKKQGINLCLFQVLNLIKEYISH